MTQAWQTLSIALLLCVWTPQAARAQTIVEMDLVSASKLLEAHKMPEAWGFLRDLSNNYKKFTNIRIHSNKRGKEVQTLARALRTDFDGSGTDYIPELTIWKVIGNTGARIYLAASMMDRDGVLLSAELNHLKGMLAFEMLQLMKADKMSPDQGRRNALKLGIEIQIIEGKGDERSISFFGHDPKAERITGKLMMIEPPDFLWR